MTITARRIFTNGMWGASQQALTVGLNALLSILIVLFLSVNDFGVYSYAIALAVIGNTIMTAGLNSLAIKELVNDRAHNASIVTAVLLVREFFAVVGFIAIGLVSLTSGNPQIVLATLVSTFALFARALDAPENWFLSHLRTSKPAMVRIVVSLVLFGVRLAILMLYPNIWLLLATSTMEAAAISWGIIWKYRREYDSPGFKRPDIAEIRALLRKSWPLALAGLANQFNLKGSIVIIQAMLGTSAVAVYSAAARLSEISYFLPIVFMNSTMPALLEVRKTDGSTSARYQQMLQSAYDRAFWVGAAIALGIGTTGVLVITFVFGDAYEQSIPLLLIQLCACPFVFMAAVYSRWNIIEGYFWADLIRHGLGAVANIGLNIMLIPSHGLIGSAIASVVAYVVASYLASFIGRRSAPAARQMSLALIAPIRAVVWYIRTRSAPAIERLDN